MGCGEAHGTTPSGYTNKTTKHHLHPALKKQGQDFFFSCPTLAELHIISFWFLNSGRKVPLLQAGLRQNKSRPSGSLSWGTLCSWVSAGLRQSSHPFGRRMLLSGRVHLTSPEVLSGWHSLESWPSLHTLTTSIPLPPMKGQRGGQLFKTWKSKAKLSTLSLTSHPSDHGSHSLLTIHRSLASPLEHLHLISKMRSWRKFLIKHWCYLVASLVYSGRQGQDYPFNRLVGQVLLFMLFFYTHSSE